MSVGCGSGASSPDQRLELIDGEIMDMAPQNEPHAVTLCLLDEALRRAYGDGYVVRIQCPVALDASKEPRVRIEPLRRLASLAFSLLLALRGGEQL